MKKYFIYIIIIFHILFVSGLTIANADIGDIGHWQDSIGGQIPNTNFGGFDFDNEIRNDGIYTKPNDSTIQVTEPGDYLIISTTHDEDTSNGRYNSQLTISQISGTGDIFNSRYTGYSRDNSENESWTRAVGVVVGASANSEFQVQKRRDTDAPTGGSVVNSSDLQIIKLDQSNYGLYEIAGTGNNYGGISPNTVELTNIINESDISSIEGNTETDTVTIKGDNKKYIVAWSVSFDGGSSRTQRIGHLEYNNIDELSTRSYCYSRSASNEYCGLGSMDIIKTNNTDINLQTEVYRGDGVGADQGGADIDGSLTTDGSGKLIVLELPDYVDLYKSKDSVGLQDITTNQNLNINRDVEINENISFNKSSNTVLNVNIPADILSWANIWTARGDVGSGQRQTSYGSIVINGAEQTTGRHGNYSRGNQGNQDTFAMGFQPGGIYAISGAGETIGVNSSPLAGGEGGGNDRTQAGTLGFYAINIDTFSPPTEPNLGVLFYENDDDNIVETEQVVKYSIEIKNNGTDASGIDATSTIDNNFGTPYGFSYSNCGTPSKSFTSPNLFFSNISILGGNTCKIEYHVQVDTFANNGAIIPNNLDVSNANEGGNNPSIINADNLSVLSCSTNDVNIIFETDNFGEDTYWSLTPNGNSCGIGEIANGGNTNSLSCNDAGLPATASPGDPYPDSSIINEGPFSLNVGSQYDLHVIDDYGDGITVGGGGDDPDIRVQQNGGDTDTFSVTNDGGVFSFTVEESNACIDTTNPEVSINQSNSQSDPTATDSITYNVVFSEAINTGTFSSADISITGTTGTITSGPTEISPFNGTNFEFSVSGMSPSDIVTATIPAGTIEDLAGNTNNQSNSIDNQVTYNGDPPSNPVIGVTYTDNDSDNIVQTSQVVKYNIDIKNSGTNASGISTNTVIDNNFGAPYGISYINCGSPTYNFTNPNLDFSNISISSGETCSITYYVQVDNLAPDGTIITSSTDVSSAIEGGNDPAITNGDNLSVLACGINDVNIEFTTDNWGYETFWSLTPSGNSCGIGEIANGGNTTEVNCNSGGTRSATNGNGYASNSTITEGAFSLNVGIQYDLHVVDDYGDGITTSPDVNIIQNSTTTDTFEVDGNGGTFTFTVQQPNACIDNINPEVNINQSENQDDPTNIDSASFTVVFNEAINTGTFTSADISIIGTTGTITSGPSEISPFNGTIFEFVVSGMSDGDIVRASIPAGGIEDLSGNTNNASTSQDNEITFSLKETNPPTISSTNYSSGALLPGGNHDLIISYNDTESGIDTNSDSIELNKWNGSSWGTDISTTGLNLGAKVVNTTSASYQTNNLDFGKYRYIFNISDNDGNTSSIESVFYIDEPDFELSSPNIDIGNIGSTANSFSPTYQITVKTVGAGFDIKMNSDSQLNYTTNNITSYDGQYGYGYQQSPYSGTITAIGTDQVIANQAKLINTNGDKNTYTYEIQLGGIAKEEQSAGEYIGNIDFSVDFNY